MPNGDLTLFTGDTNMSLGERAVSIVGGLALAAIGTQPRPNMLLSAAAIILGSGLAIRGATGHCPVKALTGSGEDRARLGNTYEG